MAPYARLMIASLKADRILSSFQFSIPCLLKYSIFYIQEVNGILIEKIIIDEHVDKHADHIDDSLILKVVAKLDGHEFKSVSSQDEFEYFMTKIKYEEK